MKHDLPRLSDFGLLWRVGVGLLVICLVGGYMVAGMYLKQHYENRDERPKLTFTDIQGAYAGATVPSPMLGALERGHPDDLADMDRAALIAWLTSDTVRADYENFDLGDAMPADVIAISCLECHSRSSAAEVKAEPMLDYPDDVFGQAESKVIKPKDKKVLVASIHAHLPSMATCSLVLALLAGMTRWPRALVGAVVIVTAVGLIGDFGGQWLARTRSPGWTWAIVVGGFAASVGVGLLGLLALADAWLPGGRRKVRVAGDDLD
ncbi:MAG: hypothetical protein DHS20C14_13770 [Phycisphaeraceae bacterium]|nr:MAG: hypothetical protein DHS20C14_13770 [Phycisphaeraceae bacterium]